MIMWKAWNDKLTSTYLYSAVAVGSVEDYNGIQLIVLVLQLDILIQSHSSPVLWLKKNSLWKRCQEQATNRQSKQLAGEEYGAFIKWGASHFYLWQIYFALCEVSLLLLKVWVCNHKCFEMKSNLNWMYGLI